MLTDNDLKKMMNVFATKEDLRQINEKIDGLATKEEINKMMNGVDKMVGELRTVRQEQLGINQRENELDERVTDIELIPVVAHELKKKKN